MYQNCVAHPMALARALPDSLLPTKSLHVYRNTAKVIDPRFSLVFICCIGFICFHYLSWLKGLGPMASDSSATTLRLDSPRSDGCLRDLNDIKNDATDESDDDIKMIASDSRRAGIFQHVLISFET